MSERIIYLNGDYLSEKEAKLPSLIAVCYLPMLFMRAAVFLTDKLSISFIICASRALVAELSIPMTFGTDEMFHALMGLLEKNNVKSGFLYLHVTRGVGDRAFHYHDKYVPNIFAFTQGEKLPLTTRLQRLNC